MPQPHQNKGLRGRSEEKKNINIIKKRGHRETRRGPREGSWQGEMSEESGGEGDKEQCNESIIITRITSQFHQYTLCLTEKDIEARKPPRKMASLYPVAQREAYDEKSKPSASRRGENIYFKLILRPWTEREMHIISREVFEESECEIKPRPQKCLHAIFLRKS